MPFYKFVGLNVFSEIPLPIPPCDQVSMGKKEINLSYLIAEEDQNLYENLNRGIIPDDLVLVSRMRQFGQLFLLTYKGQENFHLFWNQIGLGFSVSFDAKTVRVSGITFENVDQLPWFMLSQVLGFVLHLKGLLCLHASVVQKSGLAVGLLGTNGRGKSTLTASLVRSGWSLVSDDILCIEDDTMLLKPCFPFMKLRHDSIDFLGLHQASQMPIIGTEKMKVDVDGTWGDFTDTSPLNLKAIYFVRRSHSEKREIASINISALSLFYTQACLTSNGFVVGLLPAQHRRDYTVRARLLAERIPIRYLNYPSGLNHLRAVGEALFADVSEMTLCKEIIV